MPQTLWLVWAAPDPQRGAKDADRGSSGPPAISPQSTRNQEVIKLSSPSTLSSLARASDRRFGL